MKISDVSMNDGKMCAQLLNLLKMGRWELSGPDIAAHSATVQWVHYLASQMASELKPTATADKSASKTDGGLKIKAMGPIGSQPRKKK